jgi:hypothetical protein
MADGLASGTSCKRSQVRQAQAGQGTHGTRSREGLTRDDGRDGNWRTILRVFKRHHNCGGRGLVSCTTTPSRCETQFEHLKPRGHARGAGEGGSLANFSQKMPASSSGAHTPAELTMAARLKVGRQLCALKIVDTFNGCTARILGL